MEDLTEQVRKNDLEYVTFFRFASEQTSHINWHAVKEGLQALNSGPNGSKYIEDKRIDFYSSDGFGCSMSDKISIGFVKGALKPEDSAFMLIEEFLYPECQLDSLFFYASQANVSSFSILKDGTVVTEYIIGPNVYDLQIYECVYPGSDTTIIDEYYNEIMPNMYLGMKYY